MDGNTEVPFEELVGTATWRAEVEAWIHDRVLDAGHRLCGPLEQTRVRPWSTQLVVPTDHGRVWFKACCPPMRFEPGLQQLLAEIVPDDVAIPRAVDARRGWLLTDDRGPTLGDLRTPTTADWTDLLRRAAQLQRRLVPHREEVLATGVPDCAPATVPDRLERLTETLAALPPDHPSHLDETTRRSIESRAEQVAEAADALATSALPSSVQHGDLHPWNAFADLRLFDLGDLQWAHPLEILLVPRAIATVSDDLEWEPLRDAYLEGWTDVADRGTLRALAEAAVFTHAVNRAQTWLDGTSGATSASLVEWGGGALQTLTQVLHA